MMQIRPLEDLTKDELISLITQEREQAEAVGAGGVSLMGYAEQHHRDSAELRKLRAQRDAARKVTKEAGHAVTVLAAERDQYAQTGIDQVKVIMAKDAEIARLRYALRGLLESHAVPSTACKERTAYEKAIAALTQQEPK